MNLTRKVDFSKYEQVLQVIDSHTVGEFCRIVTGGFKEPEGNTMIEKKNWMRGHADHLRTALMLEPRGHREMFGAFLVEPVNKEADFGVIFMDTGGYLNMCGHCTIGAVTCILEGGLHPMKEGENEVTLEAPAGLIRTKAMVKNGKVESVTLTNVPAFVYKDNLETVIDFEGKSYRVPYTISFGGSFFALIDTRKIPGIPKIEPVNANWYARFGMALLPKINAEQKVKHPLLDITTVDLVEFFGATPNPGKAHMRNCVVFGDHQVDRSPCGTGTSAKLATLYHEGKIKAGDPFNYESIIGSIFNGVFYETTKVGDFEAVIPQITGSCYLTGVADYIIDQDDAQRYGFVVG